MHNILLHPYAIIISRFGSFNYLIILNKNFRGISTQVSHLLYPRQFVKVEKDSQGETLIPDRIERGADGLGLLFAVALGVRNQFELNVGV